MSNAATVTVATETKTPVAAKPRYDRSIIEGPLIPAVWKIAWPTMLQNIIGGLQGVVDHAMVGHFVGHAGNAAIGVSIQIWILVIVFISRSHSSLDSTSAAGSGRTPRVMKTSMKPLGS